MEVWKGEIETRATVSKASGNRNQGALKAQLHIAHGSAMGHRTYLSIYAPCKGNCIKIEGCNRAIEGCSCPYRAHFLYPYVFPGRCIYDAKTGCARHSSSELDSALACTVFVPGLMSGRKMPHIYNWWGYLRGANCNKILPKNGSLIFRKPGVRKA